MVAVSLRRRIFGSRYYMPDLALPSLDEAQTLVRHSDYRMPNEVDK
jgi:hypothetical protein